MNYALELLRIFCVIINHPIPLDLKNNRFFDGFLNHSSIIGSIVPIHIGITLMLCLAKRVLAGSSTIAKENSSSFNLDDLASEIPSKCNKALIKVWPIILS